MSTPAVITKSQALAIHDAAIEKFGGVVGVRDEGALDSALAQPYQTFGGSDLYEGDIAKACRLCFGVIADHPFADGNKRTGAALLGTYLRLTTRLNRATTSSSQLCSASLTAPSPTNSSWNGWSESWINCVCCIDCRLQIILQGCVFWSGGSSCGFAGVSVWRHAGCFFAATTYSKGLLWCLWLSLLETSRTATASASSDG
ncbi:type II toxin-antitoxin system death-on-curing family toxin [Trueperella pyogenes]|uniref:type II toxin-antitoxin system death-on-curing family toxin n=1 Tax=Trueperella pyogenes TaxID=1661 RepID=UPI00324563EC